jgi:hypothetical protein
MNYDTQLVREQRLPMTRTTARYPRKTGKSAAGARTRFRHGAAARRTPRRPG